MRAASLVLSLGACLWPLAAAAQTQATAECANSLGALRVQTNLLLDAAIHGESVFNEANAQSFTPAVNAALAACRTDDRAKRAIYDVRSQLSTYQGTRDTALSILQSRPPTPAN